MSKIIVYLNVGCPVLIPFKKILWFYESRFDLGPFLKVRMGQSHLYSYRKKSTLKNATEKVLKSIDPDIEITWDEKCLKGSFKVFRQTQKDIEDKERNRNKPGICESCGDDTTLEYDNLCSYCLPNHHDQYQKGKEQCPICKQWFKNGDGITSNGSCIGCRGAGY